MSSAQSLSQVMRKCLRKRSISPPKGIILLCLEDANIFLTSACIHDDICHTSSVRANTGPLCELVSVSISLWTASHPFCKSSCNTPTLPECLIKILLKAFFKNVLTCKCHLWKKQLENFFVSLNKSASFQTSISKGKTKKPPPNHNENYCLFSAFFFFFSLCPFLCLWGATLVDWNLNCPCFWNHFWVALNILPTEGNSWPEQSPHHTKKGSTKQSRTGLKIKQQVSSHSV